MISNNRGNKGDDSGHSGFKTGLGSEHGGLCHHQLEDRRLGSQGEGAHWGRRGLQVEDFALKKLHLIIATLSCCVCVFVYFQHDFTLSISCQWLLTSYSSDLSVLFKSSQIGGSIRCSSNGQLLLLSSKKRSQVGPNWSVETKMMMLIMMLMMMIFIIFIIIMIRIAQVCNPY